MRPDRVRTDSVCPDRVQADAVRPDRNRVDSSASRSCPVRPDRNRVDYHHYNHNMIVVIFRMRRCKSFELF